MSPKRGLKLSFPILNKATDSLSYFVSYFKSNFIHINVAKPQAMFAIFSVSQDSAVKSVTVKSSFKK